jgi:hypothetical protein
MKNHILYGNPYTDKRMLMIMATIKTTLNIDSEIMQKIKIMAVTKNKTQTEIVNKMLKQGLKNETKINNDDTLEERINKNPHLKLMKNPMIKKPKKSFNELIGSIKTDEPVNAVKLVNEVRRGE